MAKTGHERKKHEAPLLDKKFMEAVESGIPPHQIEAELVKLVKSLNPAIMAEMAKTGKDKKTVLRTMIAEKYQELESGVGITWESLASTVEEAVAAVKATAEVQEAVGEEEVDEDLMLVREMMEDERKKHEAPLLDKKFMEAVESG